MEIKNNSLLAEMQRMAIAADATTSISLPINPTSSSGKAFGDMLTDALKTVSDLQQDSSAKKTAFQLGDKSVTLAETMIAAQKAGIAFEATVQVRNKFVEAYKEIMSMPV
jgi:flagellar hook-basal body complex protein FliE